MTIDADSSSALHPTSSQCAKRTGNTTAATLLKDDNSCVFFNILHPSHFFPTYCVQHWAHLLFRISQRYEVSQFAAQQEQKICSMHSSKSSHIQYNTGIARLFRPQDNGHPIPVICFSVPTLHLTVLFIVRVPDPIQPISISI